MLFLKNWFLPHEGNNHKAHLIKSYFLFLLCFVFAFLQVGLNFFLLSKPAVLGFSANITPERIIELTNKEREKQGLGLLKENQLLSEAARQKAADMFAFNYWAHISPSGRTPWTFFTDVGYQYQYAGENLARDFRDPDSVVQAWMASPSHRENMVNPKYQEIGVAVVDGSLQGVETTLVVQLFGTPYGVAVAESPAKEVEKPAILPRPAETLAESPAAGESALPQAEEEKKAFPLASPLDLTRAMVILVVGILIGAFAMDVLTVSHRETPRLSSRSLAQMMFLIFVLVAGLFIREGAIL